MTTDGPRVLLTNDDGIEADGLRALRRALEGAADVSVVAPAEDRSSVGRALSHDVRIREHERGYAIEGTPADCVVVGLGELYPDVDAVIAGCNAGANLGTYTLGRSGTVSAAVEASFFGVPAIAVSLFIPPGEGWWKRDLADERFRHATDAARYLLARTLETDAFDRADYLNVNAPFTRPDDPQAARVGMEVTRPSTLYEMDAARDGDAITLRDGIWERMRDGSLPDPAGTDRRAIVEGRVSVSPLTAPHSTEPTDALESIAAAYGGDARADDPTDANPEADPGGPED